MNREQNIDPTSAARPLSRRGVFRSLVLPMTGLALGGCAASMRQPKSEYADSSEFPNRLGAHVMRPDGTRAFRNHKLFNQDGKIVRFQDDLIEGKVFSANFMYVHCKGICPNMTARLMEAYELLRPVMGSRVQFYSFSLAEDPPQDLREYMEERGLYGAPGWQFLSGTPEVIKDIRWAFGLYDLNEEVDNDLSQHTGMARYGTHRIDKWAACPILGPGYITAR
ncbi:MAG: SCO family protein, partial [Phycisphaerales bacterium]